MAIPAVAESISGIRYHRYSGRTNSEREPTFKPKTVLSKQNVEVRRRGRLVQKQLNLIKRLSLHAYLRIVESRFAGR